MYKRFIFFLAAISLVLIWTSLAQDFGTGDQEQTNLFLNTWQVVTEVDTWQIIASWLDIVGNDRSLLSGDLDFGTIGSGIIETWNLESEIWNLETGDQEPETWSLQPGPIFHLIISEVYFDGTDEWIEITNIGDGNFQWDVTLVGVKSVPLSLSNISILSGESKIFGDNLSQISGNWCIGKTGLSLNLIDTAPIYIQLLISGQREDIFLVDQYWVDFYNDKKTSFEKVNWISTRVKTPINNQTGYTINPWGVTTTEDSLIDVSFPPSQSSGNIQLPLPCVLVDQDNPIKINEIFLGDENYPPYIELAIDGDITIESLSISGDLLETWIEFLFDTWGRKLENNSFFLISSSGFRNTEGFENVRDANFRLLNNWNRLLITIGSWQNRQVMDIVYVSGENLGWSWYFDDMSVQCARVFDAIDYFSPGFDQKFLKYISGQTLTKIEYIEIMTGNQPEVTGCLLSGQDDLFSWVIQETTSRWLTIDQYTIRIVDVDYDPEGSDTNNEKVTLLATHISWDTTPLDLSKIFRLKVNGTNKTLPWTLPMNTKTTFTKTFGFPNSTKDGSDVVLQLTYGDKIFDTYIYNPNRQISEEPLTGDVESTENLLDLSGLNFSITYVLPNPKWSDTHEEIGISIYPTPTLPITWRGSNNIASSLRSGEGVGGEVAVRQFNLSQDFSLKVGSRSKNISWILFADQENVWSGSLGLVNKAACVSLFYQEVELDKFCYPSPKEGQKIYSSYVELETVTENDLDILNKLTIKRVGNTLCTSYLGSTIICKRIPASKAETKTVNEKNLYKGFSTLIKNYLIDDWSAIYYDTKVRSYFDMLATNKSLISNGISKVDIYGQSVSVTSIKKQIEIIENTAPVIIAAYEWIQALQSNGL